MREILFRAKDSQGMWHYGDLISLPKKDGYCGISEYTLAFSKHICKSKTLGQYTGLTDKIGTKIFEGDICKFYNDDGETSLYTVEWDKQNCRFAIRYLEAECGIDDLETSFTENCKVIGNIFDNPDLLEGEKNNG